MKNFGKSFYGKLSAVFLILLLVMAGLQIWLTLSSAHRYQNETDRALNSRLARDIATDFAPFVSDSINFAELKHQMHFLMLINPKIEIYLLNQSGKILAYFADPGSEVKLEYVDLDPVAEFLAEEGQQVVLGDNPRNPPSPKPFSVAPLQITNQQGYLYVITESQLFDSAANMFFDNFIAETVSRGLLLAFLGTAIAGLLLFALLTRRLRQMTETVKRFEHGKLDERINVTANDEIGQLGNAFNHMADTINGNIEQLRHNDSLRRELVANISHDLRSPLASIKGYLETILMKEEHLNSAERERYINIILNTANMLEKLVDQLFELSKLDARQIEPQFEPFSICDLIQDVIMKFQPVAKQSGISLSAKFPEKLPLAYADIGLIERALSNLIENALHYTPQNGKVVIEVQPGAEKLNIRVIDTGCGIPEKDLPHIFDRFYRADKSRARETGGTGLGLAIAKRILEVHKSFISVTSELNVGTRFMFALQTPPVRMQGINDGQEALQMP